MHNDARLEQLNKNRLVIQYTSIPLATLSASQQGKNDMGAPGDFAPDMQKKSPQKVKKHAM